MTAALANLVMVAPTDTVAVIQAKLNSIPAGGTLAFPGDSAFDFNYRTVRGKSDITILANGPVTINGAPGPGTAGASSTDQPRLGKMQNSLHPDQPNLPGSSQLNQSGSHRPNLRRFSTSSRCRVLPPLTTHSAAAG